jgi:cell division septation protein DedD
MKSKDFREIQVSSSLLVVIFLGVLALGVFIFLLGVSVGKKQVLVASGTKTVAQQIQELPTKGQPALKPEASGTGDTAQADANAGAPPKPAPTAADTGAKPASAEVKPADAALKPPAKSGNVKPAPKTETSPPPAKTAAPSAKGLYYVQVAALKEKAMADAEAEKYKKRGYTAVVMTPLPTDKTPWYRVRLGGFSTRDKAVELLGKLSEGAKKKPDYVIVKD